MNIMYYILYSILWLLSRIPLRVLFLFSDLLYPFIYYVARYRRGVVRTNLINSFPDKDLIEIIAIEKRFYRHFVDMVFETVKFIGIRKKDIPKHFKYKNPEIIDSLRAKNLSAVVGMGHYGNWEWLAFMPYYAPDYHSLSLYKTLHNKAIDRLMIKIRSRFDVDMIPMQNALRQILKLKSQNIPMLCCFIADQAPMGHTVEYCTMFLNQPSAIFSGLEKIAKHTKQPVLFLTINKVKRGQYEMEFFEIAIDPSEYKEYEITEKYTVLLEKHIQKTPEYWLWTHKRWKRSHIILENRERYILSPSLKEFLDKNNL